MMRCQIAVIAALFFFIHGQVASGQETTSENMSTIELAQAEPTDTCPRFVQSNDININSDFEGGNAELVSLDQPTLTVRIMPAIREGSGWPCWWYFRADRLPVGETLVLEVQAQSGPYAGNRVLAANWCQPKHASISVDDKQWTLSTAAKQANGIARYEIEITNATMWFAWGPPFLPRHAETLLDQVAQRVAGAEKFELAKTRQGRSVWGIRLGDENAATQIWVNARQHAWETGGSWVGQGFLEWIASDQASAFRQRACIHFVPLMDVDHVFEGAGGKEAVPRDHNRDWAAEPIYPEVAAAQQRILTIDRNDGLDVYIDLHNPGPSDPIFFFGPHDFSQMSGVPLRNYSNWIKLAAENMRLPIPVVPQYKFATYVTSAEERSRMSSNWVRENTRDSAVSVTLETGWNTHPMTADSYRAVGEQLARTLMEYFQKDPRRKQ